MRHLGLSNCIKQAVKIHVGSATRCHRPLVAGSEGIEDKLAEQPDIDIMVRTSNHGTERLEEHHSPVTAYGVTLLN